LNHQQACPPSLSLTFRAPVRNCTFCSPAWKGDGECAASSDRTSVVETIALSM